MARIIDCTMIVSNKTWRGSWRVDISTRSGSCIEVDGIKLNELSSTLHLSAHCATHIDSPRHRICDGPTMDELPLERCFGEAAVVDLGDKGELEPITAEDLEQRGKHVRKDDIVLLKTGWTERNAGGDCAKTEGLPFNLDYWKGPYPTRSMAEWMVKKKVKAVGFDGPNEVFLPKGMEYEVTHLGSYQRKITDQEVHMIHLANGILQIEYLCNLTQIKKDRVTFFAVPLKIKAEASPIRAFAIEE
jgi:arylformamidase